MVKVKRSIVIDEELWMELKHRAVDEKRSVSEIIEELVKRYLEERRARP
jgi:predicted CopG family antitoxin